MTSRILTKERLTSGTAIIFYIALLKLVLHLVSLSGYGYMGDEFYYIECSEHLDFGYVDHPPLSIVLLWVVRSLFGGYLLVMRLVPALCGFFFVYLTGIIARELGAGKTGMAIAASAAFAVTGNMYIHNYYSMNCLDHLFWIGLILIVIKIIKTDNKNLWIAFGLVAGLGLQNKISVFFAGFGLAVGLLLTKHRKNLKDKNIWFGLIIALLLFHPYIIWNIIHGMPTLEFMQNASSFKNYNVSPMEFLSGQILVNNPITLPVWIAGLIFLLTSKKMKEFRLFGWMYLAIFLVFILQHGKHYYMLGIYPVLFAAGGLFYSSIQRKTIRKILNPVLISILLILGLFLAPLGLPILDRELYVKYDKFLGIDTGKMENHKLGKLPQHFAQMNDWDILLKQYVYAWERIPLKDRANCGILVANYHKAGVINVLGKDFGLHRAISGHNNCYLWGMNGYSGEVMLVIGFGYEKLTKYYGTVIELGRTSSEWTMPYDNNIPMYLCKDNKISLEKLWPKIKSFI
ncbi:MAG: glycosyltransferase family 39 protein [Acidobacteria bacterium]|nr:glycosyltransferase family 39 protein [Acidobacteriota bacterium]